MAIPAALAQGTVVSAGCIGNRTYTGLGDDEMYVVVPGRDLERIAAEVEIVGLGQQETGPLSPVTAGTADLVDTY
jgi:uncharacterized protein (DUF169 family)